MTILIQEVIEAVEFPNKLSLTLGNSPVQP